MRKVPPNTMEEIGDRRSISRPYEEKYDGWVMTQLEQSDVPGVEAAMSVVWLFNEVNRLRKELWETKELLKLHQGK